ncbi:MAG: hypothetical protein QW112_00715 [Candidatus Micrarchaeia archaeon]
MVIKINRDNLEKAAMKLLKENIRIKKKEKVVLVTDRKKDPIFSAIKDSIIKIGNKFSIIRLTDKRENSSPIPQAARIFYSSDVIIAPTTKSISHSPETYIARKRYGVRVASMPGITPDMFIDAMKADSESIKKMNEWLWRKFNGSKVVNIISPSGTNVKFDVNGLNWKIDDYGDISKKGVLNNIPFGEFYGWTTKAVGLVFVDYWNTKISPKERAWIYLQRGKIVRWNKSAESLIKVLQKAGDCGLRVIELGIGTNAIFKAPSGNILQDEKMYGTCHIAFGGHGTIRVCPIHIDIVLLRPTIWVDGRKVMEKGKLIK